MKRSLILLLLLILIGAAINIPFAMQFLHSRTAPRAPTLVNDMGQLAAAHGWPATTPHDIPWPVPVQWQLEGSFGYRNFQVYGWEGTRSNPTDRVQMQVERMGWPLPVLEKVQMWWPWDDTKWATTSEPDPAMHLAWSGVILNPILFGVTLWLVPMVPLVVFLGLRKWRRSTLKRRRSKRNECIKCGYPRGASDRCSECGFKFESPSLKTTPTTN